MPKVSFIIPLFNHLAQTQTMLASLQATIPPGLVHEIILIDYFSTDGTWAWLATLDGDPHIKTLLNPRNLGYAKTNNRAASVATGEVLALLNNDLLFEPGWLEPMLHILLSPTLYAGLVGNVQYRVVDGKLDHGGVLLNLNAQFGHIQTLAEDAPLHTKALTVTSACMLLRKVDFDEQFVNDCEDIDLCFKLRTAGKAIYVATPPRRRPSDSAGHVAARRIPLGVRSGRARPQCGRGRPVHCTWSGLHARSKWLCNVAKRRVCF